GVRLLQSIGAALPRRDVSPGVGLPRLTEIRIDGTVLLFTIAVSVVTGLVFGLAPALRRGRSNPMEALREGSGAGASGFNLLRGNRTQGVLVVAEIAMAPMLLV